MARTIPILGKELVEEIEAAWDK
ncbi:MAG: hypothetical protein RLZZ505_3358, partial [Verrucomicrobiota bacterium]